MPVLNKKFSWIHFSLVFIILVLVAGLRYRLGPDTISYMALFENSAIPISKITINNILNSRYQPGWVVLESFCKEFDSFVLFQFLITIVFHVCLFYFVFTFTVLRFTYLLLYFSIAYLYLATDVLRESLAIGFFLLGLKYLLNRDFFKYTGFILIASLFHFYALFWLVLVPVYLNKASKIISILFIIISVLIFSFYNDVTERLNFVLTNIGFLVDFGFANEVAPKMTALGLSYYLMKLLAICIVFFNLKKVFKEIKKKTVIEFYYFVCIIYIVLIVIRITAIPFIERFFNYINLFFVLILVEWLYHYFNNFDVKLRRFATVTTILMVLFYYLIPFFQISPTYVVRYYKIYAP